MHQPYITFTFMRAVKAGARRMRFVHAGSRSRRLLWLSRPWLWTCQFAELRLNDIVPCL